MRSREPREETEGRPGEHGDPFETAFFTRAVSFKAGRPAGPGDPSQGLLSVSGPSRKSKESICFPKFSVVGPSRRSREPRGETE